MSEPTVLPASSPTFWSTGPLESPSAWPPTSRPTTSARSVDAAIALLGDPELSVEDLMDFVPGPTSRPPDSSSAARGSTMPTPPVVGSCGCRPGPASEKVEKEAGGDHRQRAAVPGEQGAPGRADRELVQNKRLEGIADLRDESDRDGIRVVIELKRDAVPEVVQNNLYKLTQMRTTFGINPPWGHQQPAQSLQPQGAAAALSRPPARG